MGLLKLYIFVQYSVLTAGCIKSKTHQSNLSTYKMLLVLYFVYFFRLPLVGDIIYGRVMVDPVQNLGDSFICNIEKVFLCTGADGYVPKYNPDNYEYGCLADAASLLYRFKIIVSIFALS